MYDVIFIADIYVPGGTNYQLAENVRYLASRGQRIGILPVQLPHAQGRKAINRFVREAISERRCEVVDDKSVDLLRARHLIIDNPRLMTPDARLKTKIAAARIIVLVPFPARDGEGEATFDPAEVLETTGHLAEGPVTWAPVSNLVRQQLKRLYPGIAMTERNAHPIVDVSAYGFSAEMRDRKRMLIGRHSRPEPDKWPAGRSHFLKVYPGAAPFSVSLLGIDPASLARMIGPIPRNYRVLPYDSVAVPDFLGSIDFFVYYHHRSWVEAFGIATAEAMAAGAPCVLPRYMEANFGDAALYAAPNEVRDVVARLHRNPKAYQDRARHARDFVRKEFSVARFAEFADEAGIVAARPRPAAARRPRYDAVYLSDFASPKIFTHAFLDELTDAAATGGRIAACDMRQDTAQPIPAAQHAFGDLGIKLIGDGDPVACDELIVNDPWRLVTNAVDLGRFRPRRTTCVVNYANGDLAAMQRYFAPNDEFQPAALQWAPRDAHGRMWLESFDPNLALTPTNRVAAVGEQTAQRLDQLRRQRPITIRRTIGLAGIETADDVQWVKHIQPLLDGEPEPILTCFGERPASPALDPRILCSGYRGIDLIKWVAKLDRLVVLRDKLKADNLDYLVALCRHAGVPVFYRWRHNKERAAGSQTLEGMDEAALRHALVGDVTPPDPGGKSVVNGAGLNGHGLVLNGHAVPLANGARRPGARKTLLFVSQNGTGVGHVVRLLSIARRMTDRYDCIFLTMSQAVAFISAFGFHAEYFPSSVYSGVSYTDWVHWLRHKVDLMLDAWGVRAVVFDGNVPYAAVAEAAAARPNVMSVWIRRGMWPDSEEDRRRLRAQTYFDMVIEPSDFAEDLDDGPTRAFRDTVRVVPPIQLLDDSEIMPRAEACATLGMDAEKTNVLVQLGSGNNRDTQTIISKVVASLGTQRDVAIYNLRWPISDMPPTPLPGVHDLAVFPVARFYAGFDFSVSAAGYNTAHEVLNHRLPTVFIANTTEGMDNQLGRAEYSAGRGLSLSAGMATLPASLRHMMDTGFRRAMRRRLARLSLENGAEQAATLIDQLAEGGALTA